MYSGKLMFRKVEDCGCVFECFLYFFNGYDKESFHKFGICPSCQEEDKKLTADQLETKEELEREKFWNLWKEETKEPGTTDDNWVSNFIFTCY